MSEPCRRCGATKTDAIFDGRSLRYKLARVFGYELRQCARCRCLRLLNRHAAGRRHSARSGADASTASDHSVQALQGNAHTATGGAGSKMGAELIRPVFVNTPGHETESTSLGTGEPDDRGNCPRCGSRAYRRSRRRWFERLLRRPPMARCRSCRFRFRLPIPSA